MTTSENPLWLDDKLQFARLLCEITATAALDHSGWVELLKSMDLETEELGELFERADKVWEAAKLEPPPLTHCSGCGTALDGSYCPKCEPPEPKIGKQAHPYIEKVLSLSTGHMPDTDPDFGGLRAIPFDYGVVVWVAEPGDGVPEWITPAMKLAYDNECTLILFDRDCNEDPDLPTWDW